MKSRVVLLGILLVAAATFAAAQEPSRPVSDSAASAAATTRLSEAPAATLTLERCLDLAVRNSNRRRVAATSVDMAVARHGQALSSRYPALTASFSGTVFDENPNFLFPSSSIAVPAMSFPTPAMSLSLPANAFGPGFPPVPVPLTVPGSTITIPSQTMVVPQQNVQVMDRSLLTATLKAFYPLYTGGLAGARIAQARAGVEAARQEQRRTDLEVAYDVRRAYWGVVLARQLLAVGRDTLARMEATLELTESVYKNGSGRVKKTDYLRNKSMVETIRTMVAELENQERLALAGLEAVVEWTGPRALDVADTALAPKAADCGVEPLLKTAYASSPQLAELQAGLAAARAGIGVARSGLLPKAGLFAELHRFGNSADSGLMTRENKAGWSVGFGVEVPVFEGFRASNELREARASLQKLQQQDALLRQSIAYEVKAGCSQIAKAAAQQRASLDAYQAATENRELNVRAYQEELVETKDVIEAQLMEALLAAQHYKVLYDNVEAQAKLEMITGQAPAAKR